MKARVREKNKVQVTDRLQDELELLLSTTAQKFFESPEVAKSKLKNYSAQDILSGALITLFVKQLAYVAALEEGFDHHTYLQQIFDSMSHLFAKSRENYIEALKDTDKKNSSTH